MVVFVPPCIFTGAINDGVVEVVSPPEPVVTVKLAPVPDCDPDIITAAAALDAVIPKFVVAIVLLIASLNAAATVVVVVAEPSLAN